MVKYSFNGHYHDFKVGDRVILNPDAPDYDEVFDTLTERYSGVDDLFVCEIVDKMHVQVKSHKRDETTSYFGWRFLHKTPLIVLEDSLFEV